MKRYEANKKHVAVAKWAPAGFTCRVCGRRKPRDAYPGKGRRGYICLDCAKVSLPERIHSQQEEEIFHMLRQAIISTENQTRLQALALSRSPKIAAMALLVIEVAKAYPQKRNRLKSMSHERPELLRQMQAAGLVMSH